MSSRVFLYVTILAMLSGCADGTNDSEMAEDTERDEVMPRDDDPEMPEVTDTALQAVLQARADSVTDPVFAFVTPAAQTLSGSATYSGAATVEVAPNSRDSDVSFIAYGLMDAQVSFERSRISAQASDFLQLDATAYNATGAETSLGPIEGSVSYNGSILRSSVANGLGTMTGSVTDIDGNDIDVSFLAGATFGNTNAELITIQGPSSSGATDLDAPVTRVILNGVRDE